MGLCNFLLETVNDFIEVESQGVSEVLHTLHEHAALVLLVLFVKLDEKVADEGKVYADPQKFSGDILF